MTSDYVLCVNRRDEYEIRLDGLLSMTGMPYICGESPSGA